MQSILNLLNLTSLFLFIISIWGICLVRNNLIIILVSIELALFAISLSFLCYSALLDDVLGQYFALFILCNAAAESAIGLSLSLVYHRLRGSIDTDSLISLKS